MQPKPFHGVLTALVTPFSKDEKPHIAELQALIRTQIEAGVHGLVLSGTTGEGATLTDCEQLSILETAVHETNQQVPILVGTSSNDTAHVQILARQACEAGADALMVLTPYYNRPSQEGLYQHFAKIAEASTTPMLIYSNPIRCGISIDIATIARLRAAYPHIVGIKETFNSVDRFTAIVQELGSEFILLAGDDNMALPAYALGAHGIVSATANLIPKTIIDIWMAAQKNDFETARTLHYRYFPLFTALSTETNPCPIKHALAHCGNIESSRVRLPLSPLSLENAQTLEKALQELGLC
ncbi:MAG TPA: 4-hydroxy-tetrahydrodipicolinate synthase [Opitutae bacterium]|nr:4-hydroxy-tetrahydrodipicolinate synthase [Opitutae bacterium]|tara:strand:- start:548 stop:1441 length:894 start_codon:yes stop_codon:yes gene_type:complete